MKPLILGYCSGNGVSTAPFSEVFDLSQNVYNGLDNVDAVVFWGGTDIHPSYYNEPAHPFNQMYGHNHPSARDEFEWKAMTYCKLNKIPMIGVCRGAQLMCAFAGGKLIQDVNNHAGGVHNIMTVDGRTMEVTSAHHQMMYPYDVPHELLAWATPKRATRYENGHEKPIKVMETLREPEVVFFPLIRGLAIQGHPEWMESTDEAVIWFNELIREKLLSETLEIV